MDWSATMTSPKGANEPQFAYGELPANADADLKGSLSAIRRAAQRARQVARQTGTDLIVVRSGRLTRVDPRKNTKP
jgi:hypothetical protein